MNLDTARSSDPLNSVGDNVYPRLGRFIISSGEIPAGSDAAKLFPVFSAGTKNVEIQYCSYYGGDADEYPQLILVPPTIVLNGTTGPGDHPGSMAITAYQYITGGVFTASTPNAMCADNPGRGQARMTPFVIPPNYQIGIVLDTANSAAFHMTVGGFEIDA